MIRSHVYLYGPQCLDEEVLLVTVTEGLYCISVLDFLYLVTVKCIETELSGDI